MPAGFEKMISWAAFKTNTKTALVSPPASCYFFFFGVRVCCDGSVRPSMYACFCAKSHESQNMRKQSVAVRKHFVQLSRTGRCQKVCKKVVWSKHASSERRQTQRPVFSLSSIFSDLRSFIPYGTSNEKGVKGVNWGPLCFFCFFLHGRTFPRWATNTQPLPCLWWKGWSIIVHLLNKYAAHD